MRKLKKLKKISKLIIVTAAMLLSHVNCLPAASAYAEVLERVVAVVNDDVILLSEFEAAARTAEESGRRMPGEDILNEMINRKLLLKEATSFRLDDPQGQETANRDDDAIIQRSIDRRIRAFIHIPFEEIESYHTKHEDMYRGREFFEVRDEIEKKMIEEEMGVRLEEYIKTLRDKAYIRIQLKATY